MADKCIKCEGSLHVFQGGKWVRCSCVLEGNLCKRAVVCGVDVRFVGTKVGTFKSLPRAKFVEVQNCVTKLSRNFEKGVNQGGLVFESSSTDTLFQIIALFVKTALKVGKSAKVFHVCDLLMEISEHQGRQDLYAAAKKSDLVCFDLEAMGGINEKGMFFAGQFISMICKRRLREGKPTIVVHLGLTKTDTGILFRLLNSQFDRIKL